MRLRRVVAALSALVMFSAVCAPAVAIPLTTTEGNSTIGAFAGPEGATIEAFLGAGLTDLSVKASQRIHPDGAETVLIGWTGHFAELMGAPGLAGAMDAPLLLVDGSALPSATAEEITRLGAAKAIILGGSTGVRAGVESELKTLLGETNVTRVYGSNRYATAAAVAYEVRDDSAEPTTTVFLVSGVNAFGAALAGPASARLGIPILATEPDALSPEARNCMLTLEIDRVIIIGNTVEVSTAVEDAVGDLSGITTVERWGSDTWPATSREVAERTIERGWVGGTAYAATDSDNGVASVIGGLVAGGGNEALLLGAGVAGLDAVTVSALAAQNDAGTLDRVTVVADRGTDSQAGQIIIDQLGAAFAGADVQPPLLFDDAKPQYTLSARITISAGDGASGVASMSYSVDGGAARVVSGSSATISLSGLGPHWISYTATDRAGNTAPSVRRDLIIVSSRLDITAIQGRDRITTAIEVSGEAFPDGSDWVVIATGYNWPDALGGAALAGALDAPILLTATDALPGSVLAEIRRLGASHAYILGGVPAVSAGVENALKTELGRSNVTRLAGDNRYETSYAIAEETAAIMQDRGLRSDRCFVATGNNFPDALGASPVAAGYAWPIILVPSNGRYSEDRLLDIVRRTGSGRPIVLGSDQVLSPGLLLSLNIEFGSDNVTRLFGDDRYATAVAVGRWATDVAGFTWDDLAVATGTNFPDALAGGVLQGRDRSILLLTPGTSLNRTVRNALVEHKSEIDAIRYLGSEAAVSGSVRTAIQAALE